MVRSSRNHDDPSPLVDAAASHGLLIDRRRRRSRLPFAFSCIGFIVGTVVADAAILFLLGDSLFAAAWPDGAVTDPASWLAALSALRDPGLALASVAVGGLPGAIVGRGLAVRRLRSDRLDALLSSSVCS